MDAYALHLLGLAVEACGRSARPYDLTLRANGDIVYTHRGETVHRVGPRVRALAALLCDLGVEVPERPSVERVETVFGFIDPIAIDSLADLYACEPLTVLALLEADE